MKLLIFINLLFCQLLFAQTSPEAQFLSYSGRSLGNTLQERIIESNKIIELAKDIAHRKNIEVRVVRRSSRGMNYTALQIVPGNSSPQNIEAARVARLMFQLPLIFSPVDLGAGSNAFFDPSGSMLGVPYRFFTHGIKTSSYLHELDHAGTSLKVLTGRPALWAGVMKALKGEYLSTLNTDYYFRFAALDEIKATALSVDVEAKRLATLKRNLSPNEFYRGRGEAENLLSVIYYDAKAGRLLARQNADLSARALKVLNSVKIEAIQLVLGNSQKTVHSTTFFLDSYSRGREGFSSQAQGAALTLYWAQKPSPLEIQERLKQIHTRSKMAEKNFLEVEKTISVLIEPNLSRTDVDALARISQKPYVSL